MMDITRDNCKENISKFRKYFTKGSPEKIREINSVKKSTDFFISCQSLDNLAASPDTEKIKKKLRDYATF